MVQAGVVDKGTAVVSAWSVVNKDKVRVTAVVSVLAVSKTRTRTPRWCRLGVGGGVVVVDAGYGARSSAGWARSPTHMLHSKIRLARTCGDYGARGVVGLVLVVSAAGMVRARRD